MATRRRFRFRVWLVVAAVGPTLTPAAASAARVPNPR